MTQERLLSIVRHFLSAAGGLLLAYGIGTEALVAEVSGGALSLTAIIWSVIQKDFNVTRLEGLLRHVLSTAGIFIAYLAPDKIEQILAVVVAIATFALGQTDKTKVQEPAPVEQIV